MAYHVSEGGAWFQSPKLLSALRVDLSKTAIQIRR
jgi:hypothetical protein